MSIAYVCIESSIYNHTIVGVYLTPEEAIAGALAAVQSEHDHYHNINVHAVPIGQLATYTSATDKPTPDDFPTIGHATWVHDTSAPDWQATPPGTSARNLAFIQYARWRRNDGHAEWIPA